MSSLEKKVRNEMVELVIKIPEEIRIAISRMGLLRIPDEMQKKVDRAIQRGTPLPKGHGRLIDADKLRAVYTKPHLVGFDEIIEDIDSQPTVVKREE